MTKKSKHLTLEDRIDIQTGISQQETFRSIAEKIGKDPSTISKKIKRNRIMHPTSVNSDCTDCPLLKKAPYVCNNCPKKRTDCGFNRYLYYAKKAQEQYETMLRESRQGIPLNKESFYQMDKVLTQGIQKKQSIYHIIQTHNLPMSKATVYRHAKLGYLTAKPIDFPRMVKFKERRKSRKVAIPKELKIGRTYQDFQELRETDDFFKWLEMDTVIGRPGGKLLLTFNVSFCNFLFALLLDNKTALEVTTKFAALKERVMDGGVAFHQLFPVILTDNGSEFSYVEELERDIDGKSHLYFCDPSRPDQKGRIEKNHTLIRDILPKGTYFDNLTQEDINLVCSHVNSVKRAALNGKSAYELFTFTYGEEISKLLGISKLPAEDVCQSSKLLQHKF